MLVSLVLLAVGLMTLNGAHSNNLDRSKMVVDGPFGGNGGNPQSDLPVSTNGSITAIELWTADFLQGIRVRYGQIWGPLHGTTSSTMNTFTICTDDRIVAVTVWNSSYVNAIQFATHSGNVFGPFAGISGTNGTQNNSSRPACALKFITPSSGAYLVNIAFNYECPR